MFDIFTLGFLLLSLVIIAIDKLSTNRERITARPVDARRGNGNERPTNDHYRLDRLLGLLPTYVDPSYEGRMGYPTNSLENLNGRSRTYRWGVHYRPTNTLRTEQVESTTTRTLVNNWSNSIIGLIRLADDNLEAARRRCETQNFEGAIQAAFTSMENIARALIHCYGGKPDTDAGQDEVLRMLSRRFKDNERIEFEKAIDIIAKMGQNRIALNYSAGSDVQTLLLDSNKASETVESASKIVTLFKGIITDHFAAEISELHQACPKCRSLHISFLCFNEKETRYGCNVCHNTWSSSTGNPTNKHHSLM